MKTPDGPVISPVPDSNSLLEAALNYAALGVEVFPCDPRDKAPLVEHGNKDGTTDPEKIAAWWKRWPGALIACRIPEHLVVLDLDPRHGALEVWQELVDMYGDAPTTRWHRSGRGDGGHHRWYQRPEGKLSVRALNQWAKDRGLGQAAGKLKWTAGIDILHHGHRYSILPPSPHPETGQPYEWGEQGTPPRMSEWLEHFLTTEPEPPPARPRLRVADENSVADWFSANTSWYDVLGPAGWRLVSGDGDSNGSKWRHPNATNKHSATIKHGCLFVYTPGTDFEPTEEGDPHGYTRFRAWSVLEFDEDMSAAAREAKDRRDGPGASEPPDHSFIDEIISPRAESPLDEPKTGSQQEEPARAPEASTDAFTVKPPEEWPELIPLIDVVELPSFPIHLLPEWIATHALQVAEDLQVAVDLPAILGLGALSVATLGRASVRYPRQRWTQPLNLYTAVALPPSAGKSPAKNAMFAPLEQLEQDRMRQAKTAQLRAASEGRILKRRLDDLETVASKTGDRDVSREAAEIAMELAMVEATVSGRLMADDATVESLGVKLAEAGGAIAVVSAEGGLFDKLAGLYSDKGSNFDLLLEGWSGGRYVVDRIKRESIAVPHANVAIVTTVQPAVLDAIGARKEFAGRGLTARFLLALPPSNVGLRDRRRAVVGDDEAERRYAENIVAVADEVHRTAVALVVEGEAADLYAEWDQALENGLRPGGELAHLPEWVGKLRASMLRVAGLLHLAHGRTDASIGVDLIGAVIELGEYFVAHARHIADRWGMSGEVAQAKEIIDWVRREKLDEFSARDVYREFRTAFKAATDVAPPLELLTERGWLRPLFPGELSFGKGRASPRFAVNPDVSRVSRVSRLSRLSRLSEVSRREEYTENSDVSRVSIVRRREGGSGELSEALVRDTNNLCMYVENHEVPLSSPSRDTGHTGQLPPEPNLNETLDKPETEVRPDEF